MPKSTYSMLHLCKKEEDEINYTCICSFVQREYRQGKPETKKEQFPVGSRRENDGKKYETRENELILRNKLRNVT